MNQSIWQTIASTSWQVVMVFCFLIYLSYKSTKPKTVWITQLYITLLICLLVSAASFYSLILSNTVTITSWMIMLTAGACLGWLHYRRLNIKPLANQKGAVLLPGSWITMIIILCALAAKYYLKFEFAADAVSFKTPTYSLTLAVIYGLVTGSVFGRTMYTARVLKQA